ncbi:MAG: glutathione synthase [Sphingomonadaceae bacterium]|nr:glutathione synthase [Sphingomonadaceae bacterium]
MPLRVAVQMDPIETINIAGDSTFAVMLAGQARGHQLWHYTADALSWAEERLWTMGYPVTVQRVAGDHYRLGEPEILDLGRDVDVVLMRQDPPFDLGYITATHLLERIQGETLVVNDPASVRNAPEKVWVLDFARFMPPTAITRSLGLARKFLEEHKEIVVKPLHGNGGKAVFKVGSDGQNLASLIEVFNTAWREPHVVQAYLPSVAEGDKRIVFVDGEVVGAINRIPGAGEIRSNLALGGKAAKTELTQREEEICAAIGPELRRRGLLFVGIDVIGGEWLTEINVTSPTGIVAIDAFNGTDTGAKIWDAIEARLPA